MASVSRSSLVLAILRTLIRAALFSRLLPGPDMTILPFVVDKSSEACKYVGTQEGEENG